MKPTSFDRRQFLGTVVAGAASGAVLNAMPHPSPASEPAGPAFRGAYLLEPGLTYLNTGTIGPCRRDTIESSVRAWESLESMPLQFYGRFGAEELAEKTRTIGARFLGCDTSEIVITNSTTSGMNAIAQGLRLVPGDRVLTTDQEHGGGLLCWKYLARYHGVLIDTVAIPRGESPDAMLRGIAQNIRRRTRVISISHVFSSTGLRAPISRIAALARAKDILCVVDGAQAAGAIDVNVRALGCHAYATSGHKWLMGPKGTGLLYLSKDAQDRIRPMQWEESYNTYNNSNGVVNLAGILGLGKAIEDLQSHGIAKVEEHNLALRSRLYERLRGTKGLTLVGPASGAILSPMLTCVLPEEVERTSFVKMLLEKHRLSIRATHKEFGFNGIRFSMHVFNTTEEIDYAANVVRAELEA